MKKMIVALLSITSLTSFASCIDAYQNEIKEIETKISEIEPLVDASDERESFLASSFGIAVAIPASTILYPVGGSVALGSAVTTAGLGGGAGFTAGAFIGGGIHLAGNISTYGFHGNDLYELKTISKSLKRSLQLLREAKVGQGELMLTVLGNLRAEEGLDTISESDVARNVNDLSDQLQFCEEGEFDYINSMYDKVLDSFSN